MRRNILHRVPWRAAGLALAVLCGCASSPAATKVDPGEQLQFGIEMARRGLWNEALFRFEQARRLEPEHAGVLNDLAIAYEAVGRFEDARSTYQDALRIAPGDRDIKRNYSRFLEFYQSFKPATERKAADQPPASPPAGGGR